MVGDVFFELKGDHFFENKNPNGKMICPYDHSKDDLYEAKHQCMLKNSVIIVTSKEYAMFQLYVETTYGKNYWKKFKHM